MSSTAVESAHAAILDSADVYRVDGRHAEAHALRRAAAHVEAAIPEARRHHAALTTINEIRNEIVGYQKVNWSAHIYPLVAALEEAGFAGEGYAEARPKAERQIEWILRLEAELAEARVEIERLKAETARHCQCESCKPRVLLCHEPCRWCGANGDGCPVLHRCPHGERCAAQSEGDVFSDGPWRLVCDQCEAARDFELGFERLAKAKADREVMLAALEGGPLAPAELFARPDVAALADPDLTLRQLMEIGAVVQDGQGRLVASGDEA